MLRTDLVRGVGRAQRVNRDVIHRVAETIRAGDTEREVVERLEEAFRKVGVSRWLHTPYAWWGERTRFAGFADWEPDALPTDRRLRENETLILDAAPIVEGYPADYAYAAQEGESASAYHDLLERLAELKREIVGWAREAATGKWLFERVGEQIRATGHEVVHHLYPAGVLGHSLDVIPALIHKAPRIGRGFQLPLVGGYAVALLGHRFAGTRYPFINSLSDERPAGLYAMEPHLAQGDIAVKFESILLIDGDETRWLDPELFGDVEG